MTSTQRHHTRLTIATLAIIIGAAGVWTQLGRDSHPAGMTHQSGTDARAIFAYAVTIVLGVALIAYSNRIHTPDS